MKKQTRKPNRLPQFSYSSENSYFLTINTAPFSPVLCEILPSGDFHPPLIRLSEVGKITEDAIIGSNKIQGVTVENYVIMPNHLHLLIDLRSQIDENTNQSISATDIIPRVVAVIKRIVHLKTGQKIFQRSYYDHVIRDQKDYDLHWQYIEDNPADWLLKKQESDDHPKYD